MLQCLAVQVQGVDVWRQLHPQKVATLGLRNAGAGREVPGHRRQCNGLLLFEAAAQLAQVPVVAALGQVLDSACCDGVAAESVVMSLRRCTAVAKRPAATQPTR